MATNRHSCNVDVLQSCWTSDELPLYCSQSTGYIDFNTADFRRFLTVLVDRRMLGSQCCLCTGLVVNGIRLTKRCNALWSRSDATRGPTSTITFCMVFSTTCFEFKDMAQDPLVRPELVSVICNRRPDEGLETHIYSLCPKEHPGNCSLWWRLSNDLGCISHVFTIQGNLTGDQYLRDVLQPVVVPHFPMDLVPCP
jgi:hypothetical protein